MKGISNIVSIAILLPIVLAIGIGLWVYAQNTVAISMENNRIYSLLVRESSMNNVAVLYSYEGVLVIQFTRETSDYRNVYFGILYVKDSHFIYSGGEMFYRPRDNGIIDPLNDTSWNEISPLSVSSENILVQPTWVTSGEYYRLSDFIGVTNIKIINIEWNGEPVIIRIKGIEPPIEGSTPYLFVFFKINNQYYELNYLQIPLETES